MKEVGLFEAKTKFSELCEKVASNGESLIVTRRGKPFVRIVPIENKHRSSVWDLRREYEKKHGPLTEDFEIPPASPQTWRDPLED